MENIEPAVNMMSSQKKSLFINFIYVALPSCKSGQLSHCLLYMTSTSLANVLIMLILTTKKLTEHDRQNAPFI